MTTTLHVYMTAGLHLLSIVMLFCTYMHLNASQSFFLKKKQQQQW